MTNLLFKKPGFCSPAPLLPCSPAPLLPCSPAPLPLDEWVQAALADIQVLPIDREIALKAAQLPEHHRDPADRIIIATALIYHASLISLDSIFPNYAELKELLDISKIKTRAVLLVV